MKAWRIGVWLAAAVLAGSCGSSTGAAQDLTLSGAESGHLTSAMPAGACATPSNQGQGYSEGLVGKIGPREVTLYIEIRAWQGPQEYGPTVTTAAYATTFPTVTVKFGDTTYSSRYGKGTVIPDVHTGKVDMDLTSGGRPDGALLHVAGTWSCP